MGQLNESWNLSVRVAEMEGRYAEQMKHNFMIADGGALGELLRQVAQKKSLAYAALATKAGWLRWSRGCFATGW